MGGPFQNIYWISKETNMEYLLPLNFYALPPIDFEHKQLLLSHYLYRLDESYGLHKLSPYLLWTEKLVEEIKTFSENYRYMTANLKRDIVGFSWETGIKYQEQEKIKELEEVMEIAKYALPQLESRIQLGYKLNNKYPQFLY